MVRSLAPARVAGAVLAVAVLLSGCATTSAAGGLRTGGQTAIGSTAPGPTDAGSVATAGLESGGATDGAESWSACDPVVGSQLRERTTVIQGAVTLLPGTLPCRSVGVWTTTFALDGDAASDAAPTFAGTYTGAAALTARVPAVSGRCAASAVFFSVSADTAAHRADAPTAAAQARADLAGWPADQTATVPGGEILRGRTSVVLAGAVVGDPTRCSPGESVASPYAAIGDCWLAVASSPAAPDGATRFRQTSCGDVHTHEVYWVEGLTPQQFAAQGQSAGLSASAWARKRAGEVCAARRTSIRLADDVTMQNVYLEYLWPSHLQYPPATATGWAKAQIVCLARWKDGKPADRYLLRR